MNRFYPLLDQQIARIVALQLPDAWHDNRLATLNQIIMRGAYYILREPNLSRRKAEITVLRFMMAEYDQQQRGQS